MEKKKKSVLIYQNLRVMYLCRDTNTFSQEEFPFLMVDGSKNLALDEKGQVIKDLTKTGYTSIGCQGISKKDIPFSTDEYNVL